MAHANKRITVCLAIVAFLFILAIILLIIPYEGSSGPTITVTESQRGSEASTTSTSKASPTTTLTTLTTPNLIDSTTSTLITSTTLISTDITNSTSTTSATSTSTEEAEMATTSSGSSTTGVENVTLSTEVENVTDLTNSTSTTLATSTSTEETENVTTSSGSSTTEVGNSTLSTEMVNETLPTTLSTENETLSTEVENTTLSTTLLTENETLSTEMENATLSTTLSTENETLSTDMENTTLSTTLLTEHETLSTEMENLTSSTILSTENMTTETTLISTESTTDSIKETTAISKVLNVSINESAASKQLASWMLGLMNHSADPCQDFYQYSCGNGVDNPYLRPVDPKDAAMNRIKGAVLSSTPENPARVLYESCLDKTTPSQEELIGYIRNLVLDLGEFDPRAEVEDKLLNMSHYEHIDARPINLTLLLAKMMKHDFTPLFDLTLDVDQKNTSQFILRLTPPIFHSPLTENIRKHTCLKDYNKKITEKSTNDLDKLYEEYGICTNVDGLGIQEYSKDIMASVKEMNLLNNVSKDVVRSKVVDSLSFAVAISYAEAIFEVLPDQSSIHLSLINKEYTLYTLQEMDNGEEENGKPALQILDFTWHGLVEELLGRAVDPTQTYVQVYFPDKMSEILEMQNEIIDFDEYGSRKLGNLLLALWSQYLHSILIEPLGHSPHTEEYCLHLVTELLPDITTQLYLSSFDQERLKHEIEKVKDITKLVKKAFINQFNDGSSDSIDMIKFDIGEGLTEDYENFINTLPKESNGINESNREGENIVSMDEDASLTASNNSEVPANTLGRQEELNFPRNVFQLLNRRRQIFYSFYDKNPNDEFIMWLQSNLPYYTSGSTAHLLNTVLIPIGSVESPFYEQNGPDFINFAGLGKMISHQLLQAYDLSGGTFEIQTNMTKSPKQCQKKELSDIHTFNINDESVKATLPAELVLNEALYDSSAVQLAWEAYISTRKDIEVLPWLDRNPIKQFYIRSAQMHCEKTSSVNLVDLKESEHLLSSLRVNHMARTDPFFQQAFSCPTDSPMKNIPQCSYMPLNQNDYLLN